MGYTKHQWYAGGFFHRARGLVLLCPLFSLCLSCNIPVATDELANYKDGAERRLYLLGESRPIVYNLNDGEWRAGYVAPAVYVSDRSVSLPTAEHIKRHGYVFLGWYDNESLSGRPVSGWQAWEQPSDVTVWAKWIEKTAVPAADAARAIERLIATGSPHAVVLSGDLNAAHIAAMKTALEIAGHTDAKIMLDMRACTGLEALPKFAFFGCRHLENVVIPAGVTSIGVEAFSGCIALTSVTIPSSVVSIGAQAFSGCYCLTSVEIPNSVTYLGDWAFCYCSSLSSVTIPESVSDIRERTFHRCENLMSVDIPDSVTRIGAQAFCGCKNLTSVAIPDSVADIGKAAFYGCRELVHISVDANNAAYTDIDGVLLSGNGRTLVCYPAGKMAAAFSVPDSVTRIGAQAFCGCKNLTSVTIPDSVADIGKAAFLDCKHLSRISVGANNTAYTDIDGVLFTKDKKTLVCYPVGKADISYSIPAGVTGISAHAFYECTGLRSVTVPDSVTAVGKGAFWYCWLLHSVSFGDPRGWHWAKSASDLKNKMNGTAVRLADPSKNAEYFISDTFNCWYKD